MTRGQIVFLAALTVIGGNFAARKSPGFRRLWSA